jgi:hypothetical protein
MNSLEQEVRNKAAQVDALLRRAERASQADSHRANHIGTVAPQPVEDGASRKTATAKEVGIAPEPQASWRGHFTDSAESQAAGAGASLETAVAEEADAPASWRGYFFDDPWMDGWDKN